MFYGTKIQFAKTKLEQVSLDSGVKVCCYSKQCNCSYNFLTKSFENYLTKITVQLDLRWLPKLFLSWSCSGGTRPVCPPGLLIVNLSSGASLHLKKNKNKCI